MKEEKIRKLNIAEDAKDFIYQGPRFKCLGPNSGESFRDTILIPFLNSLNDSEEAVIDFAGTKIFSPSFLEESFCGAIRAGYVNEVTRLKFENIPPEWENALNSYIAAAIKK